MNIEALDSHVSSKTNKIKEDIPPSFIEMRYQTCECGLTFYKDTDLKKHFMETNHKIITRDISTYQCNICTRVFETKTNILQHHSMTHIYNFLETRASPKVCDICGQVLKSNLGIRLHMKKHSGEKKFKCNLCDRNFNKKDHLEAHTNRHLGVRPYPCKQCPLRFACSIHLNRHLKTHQGIKPYQCSSCSKRYTRRTDLTIHFKTIHLNIKMPAVKRKPRGTGEPRMTLKNYHKFIINS